MASQWIALGVAGGGHGWVQPVFLSVPLFFLYPIVFIRVFEPGSRAKYLDFGIPAVAIALDLLLLRDIAFEEAMYFQAAWHAYAGVVILWLALWLLWQALAIASLLGKRAPRPAATRR